MSVTGTPNWALTVKTTVPFPCTPPFWKFTVVECPKGSRSATQGSAVRVSSQGPVPSEEVRAVVTKMATAAGEPLKQQAKRGVDDLRKAN